MQKPKTKNTDRNSKREFQRRLYSYALKIIKLIENLPKDVTCKVIANQLLRCATSIGANIIEARAASSKRDFAHFFTIALKSTNEAKFWLGLLRDSGKVGSETINPLLEETNEISNIIASSILTMKGKKSN